MKRIYYILSIIFLMVPTCLNADDYQKSDKFYNTNNALTPLNNNQGNANFKKGNIFDKNDNYFDNKEIEKKHISKKEDKEKSTHDIIDEANNTDIVSGNKIINLGLVVNGVNEKHFSKVMEQFLTTVDDFDLDAGHIYLNGFPNKEDVKSIIIPLIARGATLSHHFTIPEQFNISLSPTWIIQTIDGLILLEGVKNINKYINKKGEVVEGGVPKEQRVSEREDDSLKGGSIFSE